MRFATKHENFSGRPFNSDTYDYFVFHSPYTKLVQKAFARLNFMDYRRDKKLAARAGVSNKLKPWLDVPLGETYGDRELDLTLREITTKRFNECVDPSCSVSREVGNTYTASVYMNLICLIHSEVSSGIPTCQ